MNTARNVAKIAFVPNTVLRSTNNAAT